MTYNARKDIDAMEATASWSQEYLKARSSNNYVEAVEASELWWKEARVEQTLLTSCSIEQSNSNLSDS